MKKNILTRLKLYSIIFLVVILAISIVRNVSRVLVVKREVERQRAGVEKLKRENEKINRKLVEIQTPEFLEGQIRDKLGLVKEGETVVILPDIETVKKLAPSLEDEEEKLPDPNYVKWMKLFF